MKASADTPAQTANQSHHIHPSSSARPQPTARPTMLSDLGRAAAAHLFRNSAQADITQLPRSAAAAHPATASATASARAARCTLAAGAAEAAPASAASMSTPTVPARQPGRPCTQRLDLSEIRNDAHSDQDTQQQAARLGQHTAELDDEREADVGPPATAASQAVRSASAAQALALPHPLTPAASASAPSASNQDASTTTAESSQPAGSDDSALPPPVRTIFIVGIVYILINTPVTHILHECKHFDMLKPAEAVQVPAVVGVTTNQFLFALSIVLRGGCTAGAGAGHRAANCCSRKETRNVKAKCGRCS